MTLSAVIHRTGGPEVIEWREHDLPPPGPGEVRMRHTAIGLNFIDTYHRTGLYPLELPSGLGSEAAGVIEAVGEGVTGWRVGERVATFGPGLGAYATERNVAADTLFRLPDAISDELAAAVLLKGATAECLAERSCALLEDDIVLVHAAAGGVGHILVQWLKYLDTTVIGTAGSPEKAELARNAGADYVIEYKQHDIAQRVREFTVGMGCAVVFDGVGAATWQASLDSVARRGLIVSYGNASGPVTGVALGTLAAKGSLFVTRPTLFDYYKASDERADGIARVFELVAEGAIEVEIGQRYPLKDAAEAHRALQAGETIGSTLLIP
ncbi:MULTISPECIES: quinone oxidoreductase family protein [unclassified Sphingomonas]|uniref:quinone oxidoreductase family protein n=1 Tax=unclassified Sphingomonas TaxID=196159 RepID=UPI000AD4AE78|nr:MULTISPECIES: quinone oxidoreductase [unclassified Sphingomonas]